MRLRLLEFSGSHLDLGAGSWEIGAAFSNVGLGDRYEFC